MASDGQCSWADIQPPNVIFPTDPANVIGATGFTITLDAFIGSALTHNKTDYEIWSLPTGAGTLLWSAYNDTGLIIKVVPALAISVGTRYLRCRMQSSNGKNSAWSKDKVLFVI